MQGSILRRRGAAAVAIAVALTAAPTAFADTFVVTQRGDPEPGACDADCSLREAVLAANAREGEDTISLPDRGASLELPPTGDDAGTSGDLDVTSGSLTIEPRGDGSATITIRGDRVFDVADAQLRLVNVSASWTRAPVDDGDGNGGAIYAGPGSEVTVEGGTWFATRAPDGFGGAIYAAPGGRVTTIGSTFAAGSLNGGGAIAAAEGSVVRMEEAWIGKAHGRRGGAVLAEGDVAIDSTSIAGGGSIAGRRNSTLRGGAIYVGTRGSLALTNSTITIVAAAEDGGAIYAAPGATATINAATIARAIAGHRRGRPPEGGRGGGIYAAEGSQVSVANTILARNSAGGQASDCDAAAGASVASGGANLLSTLAGGCGFAEPGDLVAEDPGLARGGRGGTIALLPGSPAIDAAGPTAPATDQRGRARDERPDIGAFEFGARRR